MEAAMRKGLALAVLFVAVSGCSSSTTSDPNLDSWTREVRVITPAQVGDRQYEEISGLEEQERIGASGEEDRRAAKLDADAVVIIACGRNVRAIDDDPMPTAWSTVVCHGVAIRWKSN
jgi:hypothetical protein